MMGTSKVPSGCRGRGDIPSVLGGDGGRGASLGAGMRGRETGPREGVEEVAELLLYFAGRITRVLLTCFIIRAGLPCHLWERKHRDEA